MQLAVCFWLPQGHRGYINPARQKTEQLSIRTLKEWTQLMTAYTCLTDVFPAWWGRWWSQWDKSPSQLRRRDNCTNAVIQWQNADRFTGQLEYHQEIVKISPSRNKSGSRQPQACNPVRPPHASAFRGKLSLNLKVCTCTRRHISILTFFLLRFTLGSNCVEFVEFFPVPNLLNFDIWFKLSAQFDLILYW